MGVYGVLWVFCFVWLFCLGFTKDRINVGLITDDNEALGDINWNMLINEIGNEDEVEIQNINLLENDFLRSMDSFCQTALDENGLAAVYGIEGRDISSTLEAIASHLAVPYIITGWTPRELKAFDTTFNIFPEASLLSQGYAALVESLNWACFAIVYENEESLIRLQDVMKIEKYSTDNSKNSITLKQLPENGDIRPILKEIRQSGINSIVLDCSTDKIHNVLLNAKEVNLMDDLNTNIFLTSLDAHILDYNMFESSANITTVRLFNPDQLDGKDILKYYSQNHISTFTVKTALMLDAMLLLAKSFQAIKSTHADGEIVYEPLFCNASEKYNDKYGLVSALQETVLNGVTGEINLRNGKRETFDLEVLELYKTRKTIALWSSTEAQKIVLTQNATERQAELQKRLQSHNFVVASRVGEPYLFERKDTELQGNARYYGYSMDLISEIAKIMNITFKLQITKDNLHGNLVKDLMERRADLAICDFTITPQRRADIDFSMPFMSLGIGILHKMEGGEEEANLYGFLGPLSTVVWLYIGLLYIFMSFILVLIARMSTKDWENPHPCDQNPAELENIWNLKNCCWLTLGSITTQGCDILPKGGCSRIATASWWFFSLIITSSYTANLAAFLTMSKQDDSINNIEELAAQSKVKYGCLPNGATASFFQYSNDSLYQRIWNTMINEKPSVFEDTNLKGVERVLSTKNALYAFFMESTGIEYEMERKCDLKKIGDLLDSKSYGIGMPMNAEYRHEVNAAVLNLQETGKLVELKEKWWKQERPGEPCPSTVPVNTDAMALENVGGVFIVLASGIGIAFAIAILEFLWNVYSIAVEEHISYFEALKIELKFACNIFVTHKRSKPLLSGSSSSNTVNVEDSKSNQCILTGAGTFLNINTTILNRIGSTANLNQTESNSAHSRKSGSKSNS
uniref:Ionotropic glutamate receptor C-terminal domain-containing protein n=3 Tax=Dendroctonus ponderosae TaxID=77166 RepID=A0AAR5PTC5_DENPD